MKAILTTCMAVILSLAGGRIAAQPQTTFDKRTAAELFGIDHVPKLEFTLPDDRWQWLQAHAVDEEEERAEMRFDGQAAGTVGLRFKGGVGSLANCVDKSGTWKCPKLSFKVNVPKFDADNRFFGLKRLNLHAMQGDPTKMHERLAYDLYQAAGIKAPRSAWATVVVNGKPFGIFSMVEEVDELFTADRWQGNGSGNIYKEVWPALTAPADFAKALETNKQNASTDAIVAFANGLTGADAAGLGAALGKWTDPGYLARYMAVDDALNNCDGVTAMYAADATNPASTNHNFFWYQEPNRDFFWLIPWDMGNTFSNCDTFKSVPRWNTVPADCGKSYTVWESSYVHAPGCDRVFQAIATRRDDYNAAVDQLLSGPFALETITGKIDQWAKFIHDAEVADPTSAGEQAWMTAVQELKNAIPGLRERLKALRDGRSGGDGLGMSFPGR